LPINGSVGALESIQENLRFIEENLAACVALGGVGLDYKTKVRVE
jgi:hypothetical protein